MNFLKDKKTYYFFAAVILVFAVVLRVLSYLQNNPFWGDEANLVIPLLQHTYKNILFSYEELGELAPPFFMFAEKIMINLLGLSEYSVRIIPLVSGIFSCGIFYLIVDKLLEKKSSKLFALIVFAVSFPLIHMSGFYKPYSSDVAISLFALYFLAFKFDFKDKNFGACFLASLLCLICFLSSFQSVFMIFSCLAVLFVHNCVFAKDKSATKSILTVSLLNLFYMLIYYFGFLQKIRNEDHLHYLWANDYSFFPISYRDYGQLTDYLFVNGSYWGVSPKSFIVLAGIILFMGVAAFAFDIFTKKDSKTIYNAMLVFTPIIGVMFAGIISLYPFANRLILSLLPLMFIIISKSLEFEFKKLGIVYKALFVVLVVSFCCTTELPQRVESFVKMPVPVNGPNEREIYKKLDKEVDHNQFVYIEVDAFMTSYVYNRMFNFNNNVLSYYYVYKNLSTFPSEAKTVIDKIKKEKLVYAVVYTNSNDDTDEKTAEIRDFIYGNYDCKIEMETPEGINLLKCQRK